jgi:plastocyanin
VLPSSPASAAGHASALNGTVSLDAGPRQAVDPSEIGDVVVYFLPRSGAGAPAPARFTIGTRSKGFTPNLLVVPVGSTVAFPNTDTILHNVYSRTPGSEFNLETYGPGQTREAVLTKPGLVIVNCNVHHNMHANVVVLETPYHTRARQDGSFKLEGLPPGPGTLVFWHPRSRAVSQSVSAGEDGIVQALVATKPRLQANPQVDH